MFHGRRPEVASLTQDQLIAHAFAIAVTRIHQSLEQIVSGRFVAAFLMYSSRTASARVRMLRAWAVSPTQEPGIQIGLKGLPNNEFLDGADAMADNIDVFILQPCAK